MTTANDLNTLLDSIFAWRNDDVALADIKSSITDYMRSHEDESVEEAIREIAGDEAIDRCIYNYDNNMLVVNYLSESVAYDHKNVLESFDEKDALSIGVDNNSVQATMTALAVSLMTHFINTSYYEAATKLGMI